MIQKFGISKDLNVLSDFEIDDKDWFFFIPADRKPAIYQQADMTKEL